MEQEHGRSLTAKKIRLMNFLAFVLLTFINCHTSMSVQKFEWLQTECASTKYPMQILNNDLTLADGSHVKLAEKRFIRNGWGEIGAVMFPDNPGRPVPTHLKVTWFSYTEEKFFTADIELPKDTLIDLFAKGYISPVTGTNSKYKYFVVGFAPEGGIAIWLKGDQVTKEVCYRHGNETEVDTTKFVGACKTIKAFVKMNLDASFSPDDFAYLRKFGVPLGVYDIKYRSLLKWEPEIINSAQTSSILIAYFNGEKEYITFPSEAKKDGRPVPKEFYLKWANTGGKKFGTKVIFNEDEVFAAFAKLFANAKDGMKLHIEINNVDNNMHVFLKNDDYILELKNCDIKTY